MSSVHSWPAECSPRIRGELIELIRRRSRPLNPQETGLHTTGIPVKGVRAVLFDVYGTLFISGCGDISTGRQSLSAEAIGPAFEDAGWEDPGSRVAGLLGTSLSATIDGEHRKLRETGCRWPEVDIRDIWRRTLDAHRQCLKLEPGRSDLERLALAYELRVNPVWPMPGARRALIAARDRGLPAGIVSNAQFFTPLLFPALMGVEVSDLFAARCCAWSYRRRRAKPGKTLFAPVLAAMSDSGITPGKILYIGNDMRNDISPAFRCGMKTVLFAGDRRSLRLRRDDALCAGLQPDAVLTSWPEWRF